MPTLPDNPRPRELPWQRNLAKNPFCQFRSNKTKQQSSFGFDLVGRNSILKSDINCKQHRAEQSSSKHPSHPANNKWLTWPTHTHTRVSLLIPKNVYCNMCICLSMCKPVYSNVLHLFPPVFRERFCFCSCFVSNFRNAFKIFMGIKCLKQKHAAYMLYALCERGLNCRTVHTRAWVQIGTSQPL